MTTTLQDLIQAQMKKDGVKPPAASKASGVSYPTFLKLVKGKAGKRRIQSRVAAQLAAWLGVDQSMIEAMPKDSSDLPAEAAAVESPAPESAPPESAPREPEVLSPETVSSPAPTATPTAAAPAPSAGISKDLVTSILDAADGKHSIDLYR